ncbi:CDP-alcohol phosphatidyltransferase family protein [Rhodobacter sp. NSM]|uniref:CDP-alcohol phosphatidyltransferase family protein n=1 Tax=Rhodobacter sp. NSM TaxID=3457501 RepID=UPI003FD41492
MEPAREPAPPPLTPGNVPGVLAVFLALGLVHLAFVGLVGHRLGGGAVALAVAMFAAVLIVAGASLRAHYPHPRLGLCNAVTQLRAALVAVIAVPLAAPGVLEVEPGLAWSVVSLAALALALDGLDGWLARRAGLVSDFGARFDIEVDALFALTLALLVAQGGKVGLWVLALGVLRYAFVAGARIWPWLAAPLPESRARKLVCVIQIASLIAMLAPPVGGGVAVSLAAASLALLIWSFGRDVAWLARR